MLSIRMVLALMVAACFIPVALGAEKTVPNAASKGAPQAEAAYDDPLGRSTPQGTVVGFLKAMQKEDEERAVEYLDTRQSGKRARQLARELQQVLDQKLSTAATTLSSKPEGSIADGLPLHREAVGVVKTKTGEHKIILERVQRENDSPVWLFSSDTLKLVPKIYEEIDIPWIEQKLPEALTETRLAGQPLYRWIMPVPSLILAFFLGWLCTALVFSLVQRQLRRRLGERAMTEIRRMKRPLVLIFSAGAIYILSLGALSLLGRLFWVFMASTIAVVGLTWIAVHLIEIGAEIIERRKPEAVHAVIRLFATLLKTLVLVIGLMIIFYYFAGINLTAVVAGLGLGGIAVAFAAQKTIENFFGGVFLVWDSPIRLGDFCKAGEHQGTVMHIGLRSTQIRTLNRTVVFVPNGQLASVSVENFTMRDRFLFKHILNLRCETTADQLRNLLAQIQALLRRHPQVESASARVRFVGFGSSSLDVEVFAYILETAQDAFLAIQEELLLEIMGLVDSAGSGLAFPSRTLYIAKDSGGSDEKNGREALEAMQRGKSSQ